MDELARGTKLGDYVVEKMLGAGGMGAVYLGTHVENGSEAALKVMHASSAQNPMLRKRFLREGRATLALTHPNVVRILASFEADGRPVLAMEVLHGISFDAYLTREQKLPMAEVAEIFLRITSALGTAHALGLVHRDLKPDNLFLLDEAPFVKILDFGIAKLSKGAGLQETSALTQTGTLMGSPFYMSPEQAFGEKTINHRSDIWSLGVMIHQALSGILVTHAESLHGVFAKLVQASFPRIDASEKDVPKDVADLVVRMLSLKPDDRPADLREVYEVLSHHAKRARETTVLFEAPITPQVFDEPSTPDPTIEATSGAVGSTVIMTPVEATAKRAEALVLTPSSLKMSPSPLAALAGTVLIAPEPKAKTPAPSAEPFPQSPPASTSEVSEAVAPKAIPWGWIVPLLVIATVALLWVFVLRGR